MGQRVGLVGVAVAAMFGGGCAAGEDDPQQSGSSTSSGSDTLPSTITQTGGESASSGESSSDGSTSAATSATTSDSDTDDGTGTGGEPLPPTWDGDRTVFVHLFEWPWESVARECELFLGPGGFAAAQVSPPQEYPAGLEGDPWFDRYQAVSYDIVGRGGGEEAFADMIQRCQAVGVDIYVDALVNHMAAQSSGVGVAGTSYTKYEYPGLYTADNFHQCHHDIEDWGNRIEVQVCELFGLSDLDTSHPYVRETIAGFLSHLQDLGVAGFRLDAAKHIWAEELAAIMDLAGGDPYVFQEVIYDQHITAEEYYDIGDVTELGHGARLSDVFRNGDLAWLENFGEVWGMLPSDRATVFIDNHDTQRHDLGTSTLSHREPELYRLATVFMLAWNYGYPKVMSSYTFEDHDERPAEGDDGLTAAVHDDAGGCREPWLCEHRWPEMARMVEFRNRCHEASVAQWWTDGADQIAFAREACGFVAINRDEAATLETTLTTSLPAGTYCDVLTGGLDETGQECAGTPVTVDSEGAASLTVSPMQALVLHEGARLET